MANEIKIEKNVPMPTLHGSDGLFGQAYSVTFDQMKVGDSVFVETPDVHSTRTRIISQVHKYAHSRDNGFRILTRKVDGGLRFWRIK